MSKDDMHVIMYKILSYIYTCQKGGITPDSSVFSYEGSLINIPENYWISIILELTGNGYIAGATITRTYEVVEVSFSNPYVTIKGVEFLQENTMMKKAARFLQETKSAIPGL